MADLLKSGAQWLRDKVRAHASRTITIKRGSHTTADVAAVVGSSLLRLSDSLGGVQIERTDRDYLIAAEDYRVNGSVAEPQRGDRIEDSTDGRVYECMAPPGEPPWRYSDARRVILRVHVKDIGGL